MAAEQNINTLPSGLPHRRAWATCSPREFQAWRSAAALCVVLVYVVLAALVATRHVFGGLFNEDNQPCASSSPFVALFQLANGVRDSYDGMHGLRKPGQLLRQCSAAGRLPCLSSLYIVDLLQ